MGYVRNVRNFNDKVKHVTSKMLMKIRGCFDKSEILKDTGAALVSVKGSKGKIAKKVAGT